MPRGGMPDGRNCHCEPHLRSGTSHVPSWDNPASELDAPWDCFASAARNDKF